MRQTLALSLRLARYLIGKKLRGIRRFPVVLMLEPLHTCNLSCLRCTPDRWAGPRSEWLTAEQCLESVDECGAPIVSVCGGEPLLHAEIDRIVSGIVDRRKYAIVCTNALLLPGFIDRIAPSRFISFAVHLDGPGKVHDRQTRRPGCFEKAVAAGRQAIERGYRVSCNTTVYAESDVDELSGMFRHLTEEVGFHGILVSPGYDFDQTGKESFLRRRQVRERFRRLLSKSKEKWFGNSQLYLDFLKGDVDLTCTAWGNPTRTPKGWQGPCYMLRDAYHPTFRDLMEKTPWDRYGPRSAEPRCRTCMVHAGFEPTVACGRGVTFTQQVYNAAKMFA